MNHVQKIAKNTGFLFVSQIVSYVLGFFFIMYTARYLGADNFGILSFALAFTGIFSVFSDLGISTLMVREVARNKSLARKYLGNTIVIKGILVIFTFFLIVVLINLLDYPEPIIIVVYLVALSVIFSSFSRTFYSIFQAFEKMEYQSVGQVITSVLMVIGAFWVITLGYEIIAFAAVYFLANIITLIYIIVIYIWKFSYPQIEVDWYFWKTTIKEAWPFGLSIFFVMIFYWIDSVMLSLMTGNEVVGWYNAAYRVVLVLLFIPNIFITAIFPIMSKFYHTSKNSLKFTFEKSLKYLAILGIPIGVGTTLLAQRIILMIFGEEYTNSIVPLQILIWSSVLIFISITYANLFNSLNLQMVVTKITGICVLFNVILNLILIPKFNLIGASIATVLTEFVSLIFLLIWMGHLKHNYVIQPSRLISVIIRIGISSALMGLFIVFFYHLNLFLIIFLSVMIYFIVLYLIKGINEEDQNIIVELIKSKT